MDSSPDRYIDANGVKLAVDDRGAGGVPLVLVHGFTGSRIDWADVIDDLAVDRRVVAWDHRGHADSTNTGEADSYTFDQLVADMEVAIDALELDHFHLLGHSMGGIVSMRYVLAHPDRVHSLILMDTLARHEYIPPEVMDLMLDSARQHGMDGLAELMVEFERAQPRVEPARQAVMLERARYKLSNMDIEAYLGLGNSLATFDSLVDGLRNGVHCPTTVLVGENDAGLRPASTEIVEAIDGAVEIVIPNAAHSPQEENRSAWLDAVRSHLERVGDDAP
jgi:pimeloyl-ACP methyl ester carboxylesterase